MIYEYNCPVHGLFEEMQKISDPPLEECPKCSVEGRREWECKCCGNKSFSPADVELTLCPNLQCDSHSKSEKLSGPFPVRPKKLISLSSFQLTGGGWARDLYSK